MKPLAITEWGDTAPPRLALLIRTRVDRGYGGPYWVFNADVVTLGPDGTPRNLSDRQPLHAVSLRAQSDPDTAKGQPYGIELRVESAGQGRLADLERAVAGLRTATKRLNQIALRFGNTDSLAEYVLRVKEAIGAECVMEMTRRGADGFYSSATYVTVTDADETRDYINALIAKSRVELGVEPKKEEVSA